MPEHSNLPVLYVNYTVLAPGSRSGILVLYRRYISITGIQVG